MEYLHAEQLSQDTTKVPTIDVPRFSSGEQNFTSTAATFQRKGIGDDAMPIQIGHYRLHEQIGKGGMGTIYRVEHVFLKRDFAMKVINPRLLDDPNITGYFSTETLLMGSLQHPNIVQTTDAGNDDGRLFIIMELLHGSDLTKYVKDHGPLPIGQALEYLSQAARGLAAAHREGIIHRDVKPSNLFLTKEGVIKLLDLGLAKSSSQMKDVHAGHLVGSPGFMAPEQILEGRSDVRSDIYSLGCTFYFMLTGHLPFESPEYPSVKSVLDAQVEKEIPSLRLHRDDLNVQAEDLIHKMTAKTPERRIQTMGELTAALKTPVAYVSTKRKADSPTKRRHFAMAVSAMILMLFAFGLSFSFSGNGFLGSCSEQACNRFGVKPISCTEPSKSQLEKCNTNLCDTVCCDDSLQLCNSYCPAVSCSTKNRDCW